MGRVYWCRSCGRQPATANHETCSKLCKRARYLKYLMACERFPFIFRSIDYHTNLRSVTLDAIPNYEYQVNDAPG